MKIDIPNALGALLLVLGTGWAHASAEPVALELNQVGSGELLWKSDRGLIPLPILDVDVELSVTGILLHGRVTQRFHNPTPEVIEALYVFPLPDGAAVHGMEMQIGDRRIRGEIQERQEARRTYENAKRSGRKTALLDQSRGNLFSTSAANINPDEIVSVTFDYLEEVRYIDGRFELRFPLTFTPRFTPPSDPLLEPVASVAAPNARIEVRLRPGFPVTRVDSDSHAVSISRTADSMLVRPDGPAVVADRDFLLTWAPALSDAPLAATFVEERDDGRYALMMLLPPQSSSEAGRGLPTETLFIIDVSGSMRGPSIVQARQALRAALDRLRPEDRFNILRFNDHNDAFRDSFQQAEGEALDAARRWVGELRATGGTMIFPALVRGLGMMGQSRSAHAQRIVFLTDGAISNEQQILQTIVETLGQVRLHTIGIGHAPNSYLMRKMARHGHGLCEFISTESGAENKIDAFFSRLDRPVLTDVQLTADGLGRAELYPSRLPDLYAGEPLLISARLDGETIGPVKVAGYTREGWQEQIQSAPIHSLAGSGIATRWARAKVDELMDRLSEGVDQQFVRDAVVEVALRHELVTRYTSFVAVEERPTRVAGALPQGGTDGPLRRLAGVLLTAVGLSLLFAWRFWK